MLVSDCVFTQLIAIFQSYQGDTIHGLHTFYPNGDSNRVHDITSQRLTTHLHNTTITQHKLMHDRFKT